MTTADISFNPEASELAEQMFVILIGWTMTVIPEPDVDMQPFHAELVSIIADKDGLLKGVFKPINYDGDRVGDDVALSLYQELDRVEII